MVDRTRYTFRRYRTDQRFEIREEATKSGNILRCGKEYRIKLVPSDSRLWCRVRLHCTLYSWTLVHRTNVIPFYTRFIKVFPPLSRWRFPSFFFFIKPVTAVHNGIPTLSPSSSISFNTLQFFKVITVFLRSEINIYPLFS